MTVKKVKKYTSKNENSTFIKDEASITKVQ